MSESINSDQVVTKPPLNLDPNFYVPAGLINVTNKPQDDVDDDLDRTPTIVDANLIFPTSVDPTTTGDTTSLAVPQKVSVVSPQNVRTLANGTTVVDVYIDVEDIPGITNYEVRITKA